MGRPIADDSGGLSIVDAVETLSSIAELDPEIDISAGARADLVGPALPVSYHTVAWLRHTDVEETLGVIRETFKVVLRYLRGFYKEEHGYLIDTQTMEGIKTIMALVGEAAKKLDYFSRLFHGERTARVVNLREYKLLQDFYHKRIARKVDESILGKWVLALAAPQNSPTVGENPSTIAMNNRVVIDLDAVKRDTEYELFFMRREDGTRFINPSLLRNIRLVCDFGESFGEAKFEDPLGRIGMWRDALCHSAAQGLLKLVRKHADDFFHQYARNKEQELVIAVNYALMALALASNSKNLMHHRPAKTCHRYFLDFLTFLRQALQTREYQKLVAYPPKKGNKMAWCLLDVLNALCYGLYAPNAGYGEMAPLVTNLVHQARDNAARSGHAEDVGISQWPERLASDYAAMQKLMTRHPNGPMYKILEMLKEDSNHSFDPLHQDDLPNRWYDVYAGDTVLSHHRLAAPLHQETLQRATVLDEFKGMLRRIASQEGQGGHLLVNLQDRTSFLEHARCEALERLQDKGDFTRLLRVVTLAAHTDFYLQMAPYQESNQAEPFLNMFQEQICGEGTGYFFPPCVQQVLTPDYVRELLHGIHRVFFGGRNVMVRRERLDLIELTHLFLVLKILDVVHPSTWSLTCKDGVDTGSAASASFYALIKVLSGGVFNEGDVEQLHVMLYGPPLVVRERLMVPERFQRAVGVIKAMLLARDQHGSDELMRMVKETLGPLYKLPLLELVVRA